MKIKLPFASAGVSLFAAVMVACAGSVSAAGFQQTNLSLSKVRVVGDYPGTTFDNTVELWFTTSLNSPAGSNCTSAVRVFVDAKNKHVVSAAYLALATGRKIDVNVDDTLPVRDGACEVSFLDVAN